MDGSVYSCNIESHLNYSGCNIRRFDGVTESPGKSQKESQEDQRTLKQPEGSHWLFYLSPVFPAFLLALPGALCHSVKHPYLTTCFVRLAEDLLRP